MPEETAERARGWAEMLKPSGVGDKHDTWTAVKDAQEAQVKCAWLWTETPETVSYLLGKSERGAVQLLAL